MDVHDSQSVSKSKYYLYQHIPIARQLLMREKHQRRTAQPTHLTITRLPALQSVGER